jgi:hypothetical protein
MKSKATAQTVLAACRPRKEVLEGELDDAIFAADFGQLAEGSAPKVYGHAETFFRNTEPRPDLRAVCIAVFKALADKKLANWKRMRRAAGRWLKESARPDSAWTVNSSGPINYAGSLSNSSRI